MGMGIINSKPYITNSVIAEVVATMTIAIFNWDIRLQDVVLKGDVLQIVQLLIMDGINWSSYGQLITNIARVNYLR
jgi:hypothetical protein